MTYAFNLTCVFDNAQLCQCRLHVVDARRIGSVLARRDQSRKFDAAFCSPLSGISR